MIGEPASKNIERLLEKNSPTEHGWLRSRWSCKHLAVELFKERVAFVSRETLRRLLHRSVVSGNRALRFRCLSRDQ